MCAHGDLMRRILAIGGGGFLMEGCGSPIDQHIIRLSRKEKPKICFVPTPSGDLPEHIEKFYAAYSARDCAPSHLAFFRKPDSGSVPLSMYRAHLLDQDVIYVGGGNTKSALGVWREWGADRAFIDAHQAGVMLTGMSAGAMCWFQAGLTDSYWGAEYQPLDCLGLLPGACAVHYSSEPARRARLHEAIAASAVPPAVAIDDFAAVLFADEQIVEAFAWQAGAAAYRVSGRGSEVAEVALEVTPLADSG